MRQKITMRQHNTRFLPLFFLLLLAAGCRDDREQGVPTCVVERTDYREEIVIGGTARSANTVTILCGREVSGTIKYIVEDGTLVKAGDTLCIVESPSLESSLDDHYTLLESVSAEFVKGEVTYGLDHALQVARMETNRAETQIAALDSLQLQYLPLLQRRIRELNLQRADIERRRAQNALAMQEIIHRTDSQRLVILMDHIRRRIVDRKALIASLVFTAPQDGLALVAESWRSGGDKMKVGDEVWDGISLVTLPDVSHMEVTVRAPETDYKRISLGDSVTFTLPADPDNRAWGHIVKKMPVGVEAAKDSKVRLYEVTAAVDSMVRAIRPESSMECRICLRALPDTLVVPAVCVCDVDSSKVVYVQKPHGRVEKREVEVALMTTSTAVLAKGVSEGERLRLLGPS